MDDQQLIVIPDGKGEVTLLDTEGGILVEHGEYSVTIPSAGVHVTQTQPQQHVVYTTQQAVLQPRVVYSPQPQQVYQVASAHPQQVVFAGGTPVQQQVPIVAQQQQVLIQQPHNQIPNQQLIQSAQQQQRQQQQQLPLQQANPQPQPQVNQQQQQQIFITSQGQQIRTQYVTASPQSQAQQQLQPKSFVQLGQHPVQQHQQLQQQRQVAVQSPAQVTQHVVQSQPQQITQTQILQTNQPQQTSTITYYEEKVKDEKGQFHIVRTPISMAGNIRRTAAPVTSQQSATPVTSHAIQQVRPVGGVRQATANQLSVNQASRLQRNTPVLRPPKPTVQLPDDQQQPSYQQAFLKQIENKIVPLQQKVARNKGTKPSAQQRRVVSQQLGNAGQQQLQSQQVAGIPQCRTIPHCRTIITSSGTASNEIQQQVPEIQIQSGSPSKKLSLTEYRSRHKASQDLKQQQQQTSSTTTIVTQSAPHNVGEEVRMVPVSVNASNTRQQYCFLQQSDGKKYLCPVDMNMKVSICGSPTATSATTTISKPAQLAVNNSPVLIVKQDGEGVRSSSSPAQPPMSLNSVSPSPTKIITSSVTTPKPPIQEQTVHSTASPEQSDKEQVKEQNEKPLYIKGKAALCSNCGILSEDLARCQRCSFRLPANVRTMSSTTTISSTKNTPAETQVIGRGGNLTGQVNKQEFYGKTGGGLKRVGDKRGAASPAQKPKGRCRGRGKAYEEPEIVSLSSDEDEDSKKPSSSASVAGIGADVDFKLQKRAPPEPISPKEPIITEDMENYEDAEQDSGGAVTGGGLPDVQSLTEGTLKGPYTSIHCRSIRIGSYKVMPRERMLVMPQGIKLKVPSIYDSSNIVTFDIPIKSIVKVLAHFGKSLPVFFLYLKPSLAESIRKTLNMTDRKGIYFDPCSYDEAHKRITILPDRMTDETKMMIKDILSMAASSSTGKLEELDIKEANEILIRSSPSEIQSCLRKPNVPSAAETKTIIIYPPPPQKCGISITTDDYACLEEEQFLNDVIIDFYLKWLLQSKLSEIHRTRTHVFSTFFYKRLTSKPKKGRRPHAIEDDPKLSAAEKRHSRVKTWTKNVDIFEKDFIIIPINEHAHWFLAIICYPGLSGPVRVSDGQPISRAAAESPRKRRSTRPRNRIEIPIIDDGEWSDRDEAEGEEDELEDDDDDDDPPPSKKSKVEGESSEENGQSNTGITSLQSIRQPCILIFDSLSGANRVRIVATLRDYLTVEHKVRKNSEKVFNRDTMKGACPRVPQQMNYSDCGIYTLQFAESFFEHPLKDYTFPIRTLNEWFPQEIVRGKREAIAKLIKSLMEQNPKNESVVLPDICFGSEEQKDSNPGGETDSSASPEKPQSSRDDEDIPFLERGRGEPKYDYSRPGKEPPDDDDDDDAEDLCDELGKVLLESSKSKAEEGKVSSHDMKMSNTEDNVLGNAIKVIPSSTVAESSSETHMKAAISVNRISVNSMPSKTSMSSFQEKQNSQVNNVIKDLIYESDDEIFPKKDKRKNIVKSNVNSVSGLSFLQNEYCDEDSSDGNLGESSQVNRVGSSLVRESSNTASTMKMERVVYMSEKNGVSEQMVSNTKTVKHIPVSLDNKSKLINGTFDSLSRGNQMVQMVQNSQGISVSNIGGSTKAHGQIISVSSQEQRFSSTNTASYSFQNMCTKSSQSPALQSASQSLSGQSRKLDDLRLSVSSTSNYGDSESGLKTVETSGGTSIIDGDTEEVLLIMPPSNNASNQSKSNRKVTYGPMDSSRHIIDERMLSGSPAIRSTAVPVHDFDSRSVVGRRLSGMPGSPPPSGSTSPTFSGSQTFRLSERVSSSGRTIAPPKRYLDDDEEIFLKKRRDKPVPGKTRIMR